MSTTLPALLQGCFKTFKTVLTSDRFGTEYELLSTELEVQWLRLREWGDKVGLDFQEPLDVSSIAITHPLEPSAIQAINSIKSKLSELEKLRTKYDPEPSKGDKYKSAPISSTTISEKNPAVTVETRIPKNSKSKSVLSIAKWRIRDKQKFAAKVMQIKSFVDDLEEITGVSASSELNPPPYPRSSILVDAPPAYSREAHGQPASVGVSRPQRPSSPLPSPSIPRAVVDFTSEEEQYATIRKYLLTFEGATTDNIRYPDINGRFVSLSKSQFKEIAADTFEELLRRQEVANGSDVPRFLSANPFYPRTRNIVRQLISTIPAAGFDCLLLDMFHELERRFPHVVPVAPVTHPVLKPIPNPFFEAHRTMESRRYGIVLPHGSQSPLIYPQAYRQPLMFYCSPRYPVDRFSHLPPPVRSRGPITRYSCSSVSIQTYSPPDSTLTEPSSIQARLQSFTGRHVNPSLRTMTTNEVIECMLERHYIKGSSEDYDLFIVRGKLQIQMCVGQKPFEAVRQMDIVDGDQPMFMIRQKDTRGFSHSRLELCA